MIRKLGLTSAILLSSVSFAKDEVSFNKDLFLDAGHLSDFIVDVGAGSLTMKGDDVDSITVNATVRSSKYDDINELDTVFMKKMQFSLEAQDSKAVLKAHNKKSFSLFSSSPNIAIDLEVVFPRAMNLKIDDGSGSMRVENVDGTLWVDDGSGSSYFENLAQGITLDDGSGSITIVNVSGDVEIDDGSGSIDIKGAIGDISFDDGSGSVNISEHQGNIHVIDDGSGHIIVNGKKWNVD